MVVRFFCITGLSESDNGVVGGIMCIIELQEIVVLLVFLLNVCMLYTVFLKDKL